MTSDGLGRDLLDDLLEISVVGSFTRIGYQARRRLHGWGESPPGSLAGRTALVTGATSGLGRASVDALAGLGARVVLLGRNEAKLEVVRRELVDRHGEDRFPILVDDMASLASVRQAADRVLETEPRLDVVVDNAGAIFEARTDSPDGIEATLATMVVGPFALVGGLLTLLRRTPGSRVVSVASGGMYLEAVDFTDLEWHRTPFNGIRAYARAKRIQVALVREWHRRVGRASGPDGGPGIRFNAMHPGWADTPGLAASIPQFHDVLGPLLRSPAEGIDTIVWLAADPDAGLPGGQLFLDRRARPFDRLPRTRLGAADRRRLWDVLVERSGGTDPAPDSARR
jgi:NAD(P)-dependent dehydrogenase (short-subunit alcohol dehydrogenase family)